MINPATNNTMKEAHTTLHTFQLLLIVLVLLGAPSVLHGKLVFTSTSPTEPPSTSVIQLKMRNKFSQPIASVRATICLMDEAGKVVGQKTQWVIGGIKDRPSLQPDKVVTYNFVVGMERPYASSKVIFNRIILADGKLADPRQDVELS